MAIFSYIYAIPRPVATTTTVTTVTTTVTTSTSPPVRVIGYFTGCPNPGLPFIPRLPPVLNIINRRLYITPYIVPRPWYVLPAIRSIQPFYSHRMD